MTVRVEADWDTLMRQAPMTVDLYLREAIQRIDSAFGAGYAKENPELVIGFIHACTMDFMTANIGIASQHISNALQ